MRAVLACLVAMALGLGGCATTSMSQLNGLLGKTVNEATVSLGKAPEYHVTTDSGAVYTWKWPILGTMGGSLVYYEVVTAHAGPDGRIHSVRRTAE